MENPGMWSDDALLADMRVNSKSKLISPPVEDIQMIITALCKAPPDIQERVIATYFTPSASFTHPFFRTGSFDGSIWLITKIYRWYNILSPCIDVTIDSVGELNMSSFVERPSDFRQAFDEAHLRVYVSIGQISRLWFAPFYKARVRLVTVLQLVQGEAHADGSFAGRSLTDPNGKSKPTEETSADHGDEQNGEPEKSLYWIQCQNDLYQTTEWIKFIAPWGFGVLLVVLWQFFATILCVLGVTAWKSLFWLRMELSTEGCKIFDNDDHPRLGDD
jgi:hypothetical protein